MEISFNTETITVKELIEQLQKLPEDYRVDIDIRYYNNGDYGDRWLDMCTCDIDTIATDNENKIVTIRGWE